MQQNDQYGDKISQDLTLLDVPISELTHDEIKKIDSLDWYCFEGNKTNHIFVSQKELEKVLGDLVDNLPPDDIMRRFPLAKIDRVLHRWNEIDNFYWA